MDESLSKFWTLPYIYLIHLTGFGVHESLLRAAGREGVPVPSVRWQRPLRSGPVIWHSYLHVPPPPGMFAYHSREEVGGDYIRWRCLTSMLTHLNKHHTLAPTLYSNANSPAPTHTPYTSTTTRNAETLTRSHRSTHRADSSTPPSTISTRRCSSTGTCPSSHQPPPYTSIRRFSLPSHRWRQCRRCPSGHGGRRAPRPRP